MKEIAVNRQAFHNYELLEKFEAGLVLTGTEIKSAREGRVNLRDAYGLVKSGEVWLLNCHISPYSHGNYANHDPLRTRKLLLRRSEINRLIGRTTERGLTLVPLIAGIAVLFFNGRSVIGWLLTFCGATIILAGIITNLEIYFRPTSLFNTLMMLAVLAGGIGLVARSLKAR